MTRLIDPLPATAHPESMCGDQADQARRQSGREPISKQDWLACEWGRLADEREHAADERDRLADEREWAADEREWTADERERAADEREARLDELQQATGHGIRNLQQRAEQAILRSNERIARSMAKIERDGAARLREKALRQRDELAQQRIVIRASCERADLHHRQHEAIARSQMAINQARQLCASFAATTAPAPSELQPRPSGEQIADARTLDRPRIRDTA